MKSNNKVNSSGARKVINLQQQQQQQPPKVQQPDLKTMLSPEGASIDDICPFVERCKDEKCQLYHADWAQGMCIKFVKGQCKKCKFNHLEWQDILDMALPDTLIDVFSHKPFVPKAKQRVVTQQKQEQPIKQQQQQIPSSINSSATKSSIVKEFADKLKENRYFQGADLTEDDGATFEKLKDCEREIFTSQHKSLLRWFNEIKELMGQSDSFNCGSCGKAQKTNMFRIIIESKTSSSQLCSKCKVSDKDLKFYTDRLKMFKYIEGNDFTEKEIVNYKSICAYKELIQSNKEYEKLLDYLNRMEELTKERNGKCHSCNIKSVTYKQHENLKYGIVEDYIVCQECYDANFYQLVYHGVELGDREVFFGLKKDLIKREMGIYYKIRDSEAYAQFTIYPRLQAWFLLMKDNAEEVIVVCSNENCKKEIRNDLRTRFNIQGVKYYACCLECKMRIQTKAKKSLKQAQVIKNIEANKAQSKGLTDEERGIKEAIQREFDARRQDFSSRVSNLMTKNSQIRHFEKSIMRIFDQGFEDLDKIRFALENHDNDVYEALLDLESGQVYNYLKLRLNNSNKA